MEVSVAAATAVVGYDLFQNEPENVSGRQRAIDGIGCAGSAAAGDAAFDLFIGTRRITRIYNKATGWPTNDHVTPLPGLYVPPGERVSGIVADAPGTNPLNVIVLFRDL